MIFRLKGLRLAVFLAFAAVAATLSCGDNATDSPGVFDIYGRVTWRPPLSGLPRAEFYLFSNGEPIHDAVITVNGQAVPRDPSIDSHYALELAARIGDTLSYSVSATQGSAEGTIIIPDTVSIIRPFALDTLFSGAGFTAIWNRGVHVEGYLTRLSAQGGLASRVMETQIDTVVEFSGNEVIEIGVDSIWVETLSGPFYRSIAPNGMELPRGVVGAAGNFHEIFITITD